MGSGEGRDLSSKAPRHPAEEALDFWRKEADRTTSALDAARHENAELERHYRLALAEIKRLQTALLAVTEAGNA